MPDSSVLPESAQSSTVLSAFRTSPPQPLANKNCAVHAGNVPELIDNAVQVGGSCSVKCHFFLIHATENTLSVHKSDAFNQGSSQYLGLQIGLLVKAFLYNLCKREAVTNQFRADLHGLRRGVGILEHTGVMNNAGIERRSNLRIHILLGN